MADRYFVDDTDSDWNDSNNWSTISGGAGGAGVPTSADKAIFDSNSPDCTADINIEVLELSLVAGFSNTLDINGFDVDIGSGGFNQAAGTYSGGAGTADINGAYNLTGGTYTASLITMLSHDFIQSGGLFNHNNGTWTLDTNTGKEWQPNGTAFYILEIARVNFGLLTGGTCDVEEELIITSIGSGFIGTYNCKKNVTTKDVGAASWTAQINLNGTGNQNIVSDSVGDCLASIDINKASGTVFFIGSHCFIGTNITFKYTTGNVDLSSCDLMEFKGRSQFIDAIGLDFSCLIEFDTTVFTLNLTSDMNITGNAIFTQTGNIIGTINFKGADCDLQDQTGSTSVGELKINGTGDQLLHASLGSGFMNDLVIDKQSGKLTITDTIIIQGLSGTGVEQIQGTVDAINSTFDFRLNSKTISTLDMEFGNITINVGVWDMIGSLIIRGNLDIVSVDEIKTGNIDLYGNLTSTADATVRGDIVLTFKGDAIQTVDMTGGDLPNGLVIVNKTQGSVLQLLSNFVLNGSGQDMSVVSGGLDLNGFDITIPDQLNIDDKLILKGNETVTATAFNLNASSSTVVYKDSAITTLLNTLTTTYNNLTLGNGKTHTVTAGVGNGIIVNGTLNANGSLSSPSLIRSATPSTQAEIDLQGTSALSHKVDVQDSNAIGNTIDAQCSIDSGNNTNYNFTCIPHSGTGTIANRLTLGERSVFLNPGKLK